MKNGAFEAVGQFCYFFFGRAAQFDKILELARFRQGKEACLNIVFVGFIGLVGFLALGIAGFGVFRHVSWCLPVKISFLWSVFVVNWDKFSYLFFLDVVSQGTTEMHVGHGSTGQLGAGEGGLLEHLWSLLFCRRLHFFFGEDWF